MLVCHFSAAFCSVLTTLYIHLEIRNCNAYLLWACYWLIDWFVGWLVGWLITLSQHHSRIALASSYLINTISLFESISHQIPFLSKFCCSSIPCVCRLLILISKQAEPSQLTVIIFNFNAITTWTIFCLGLFVIFGAIFHIRYHPFTITRRYLFKSQVMRRSLFFSVQFNIMHYWLVKEDSMSRHTVYRCLLCMLYTSSNVCILPMLALTYVHYTVHGWNCASPLANWI